MKWQSLHLCLATMLSLVGCASEPTARSLGKCPGGHTALKKVRIVYGYPPSDGPASERWRKGIEALDFVAGGCVDMGPKHVVVCRICRFEYSIPFLHRPERGSWMRTSTDAASFPLPFSNLVRAFPVPRQEQLRRAPEYTQCLSRDLSLAFESVSFRTTAPFTQIKTDVDDWFKMHRIDCRFSVSVLTNDSGAVVSDRFAWNTEGFVDVCLEHEHADNSSSVHATLFRQP